MKMTGLVGKRFKESPAQSVSRGMEFLLRSGMIRLQGKNHILLPSGVVLFEKIASVFLHPFIEYGFQECFIPQAFSEVLKNEIDSYRQLPVLLFSKNYSVEKRCIELHAFSSSSQSDEIADYINKSLQMTFSEFFETSTFTRGFSEFSKSILTHYSVTEDKGPDTCYICSCGAFSKNAAHLEYDIKNESAEPLEKIYTPGQKTIEEVRSFLNIPLEKTLKAVFYEKDCNGTPVMAVLAGYLEIDESKLSRIIGCIPEKASPETVEKTGAVAGFASALGISRKKCRIIVDKSAKMPNLVAGANKADYHYTGFNLERDVPGISTYDIAEISDYAHCSKCQRKFNTERRRNCVSHYVMHPEEAYLKGFSYLDQSGKRTGLWKNYISIDILKLAESLCTVRSDNFGPKFPVSVAPYSVSINPMKYSDPVLKKAADSLAEILAEKNISFILDDRNERPGVQFADSELLGCPVRAVISKSVYDGTIELKSRFSQEKILCPLENAADSIINILRDIP